MSTPGQKWRAKISSCVIATTNAAAPLHGLKPMNGVLVRRSKKLNIVVLPSWSGSGRVNTSQSQLVAGAVLSRR